MCMRYKSHFDHHYILHYRKPEGVIDYAAYGTVNLMRFGFDLLSGYKRQQLLDTMDERAVLTRCIFLETVAGVPGFAAGMIRHLGSLRNMERDHGWIHTLIEEAENFMKGVELARSQQKSRRRLCARVLGVAIRAPLYECCC